LPGLGARYQALKVRWFKMVHDYLVTSTSWI
jgi:hypothetical protein